MARDGASLAWCWLGRQCCWDCWLTRREHAEDEDEAEVSVDV
jgi:hypothetical protein